MEEHKVIMVVVILGMTAIVMMGMVAKTGLLEQQVASGPRIQTLRRQNAPSEARKHKSQAKQTAGAAAPGDAASAAAAVQEPGAPGAGQEEAAAPASSSTSAEPQKAATQTLAVASAKEPNYSAYLPKLSGTSLAGFNEALAKAEKALVRLSVADHHEVRTGVGVAVRENGLLLTGAPLLAGGYEAWCVLPTSKQETGKFKRCVAWSPETGLALARVDDQSDPLTPLGAAASLPAVNERVLVFFDNGQLVLGRSEATVQALLNTADVERKLQTDLPQAGDAVWLELQGAFPNDVQGAPVVNTAGELAGVAVLDAPAPAPSLSVFGGGGALKAGMSTRRIYALTHGALRPLLDKAAAPTHDLLFTLPAKALSKTPKGAEPKWSVKLPSGETLDAKTFTPAGAGAGVGTLLYPGGARCATLALSERKEIDGTLTVCHSQGKEILAAGFVQGRRDGLLAFRNADGQCVLACQFERGARHGYCAYFKNGAPWLVQEYDDGALGAQHLVKQGAVFYTLPPGQTLETVDEVLSQYGAWSIWDARCTAVTESLERWAKEVDRQSRQPRGGRSNANQINALQRAAIAAIDELLKLTE